MSEPLSSLAVGDWLGLFLDPFGRYIEMARALGFDGEAVHRQRINIIGERGLGLPREPKHPPKGPKP